MTTREEWEKDRRILRAFMGRVARDTGFRVSDETMDEYLRFQRAAEDLQRVDGGLDWFLAVLPTRIPPESLARLTDDMERESRA